MEMLRNPERIQNLIRTNDQRLQNIERIPGAIDLFRQAYGDIPRPAFTPMDGNRQPNNDSQRDAQRAPESESNENTFSGVIRQIQSDLGQLRLVASEGVNGSE